MKLPLPRGRRAILVLGLPVGLAAAAAFAFLTLSSSPATEVPDPAEGQHGVMLALEDRVINLQTTTAASSYHYCKIGVTVELRPEAASFYATEGEARAKAEKEELASRGDEVPLLLDALGQVVSSHDATSLTAQDGRSKLKQEILEAMRTRVGEREVIDVYFTDLVMQ